MQSKRDGLDSLLRRSPIVVILAVSAAIALLVISESSYWQSSRAMTGLGEMGAARNNIQNLLRQMVDAETGQRGYLLTGRREYLQPYQDARDDVTDTLKNLTTYYSQDPQRLAKFRTLRAIVSNKLEELDTTIRLYDDGKREEWLAIVAGNAGKRAMDQIRTMCEQLLAEEVGLVAVSRKSVFETLMLNRIGVGTITALCLLALFMYLRQTAALDAQREEQKRAIQTERDHLETQVEQRTSLLVQLAQNLQTVREDERHRLARELHDELGALLTAAKLDAARIRSRLVGAPPETLDRLKHLTDSLNEGIALKRRIIEDLHPSSLSNLGLAAALDILAREFGERTKIQVQTRIEPLSLGPAMDLTVYRMVQEALTNITKYARARNVEVVLEARGEQIFVSVRDDGVGFDPQAARQTAHGLLGMRYRVQAIAGELDVQSAPGQGTTLSATFAAPLATAA